MEKKRQCVNLPKLQVDALTKQVGVHLIEDNLFLRVREGKRGNRAHWLFRYTFKGEGQAKSFGTYPEVTLAEASVRAHEWRRDLANGIDPIAKREAVLQVVLSHSGISFLPGSPSLCAGVGDDLNH
jgi:hypothetical protein